MSVGEKAGRYEQHLGAPGNRCQVLADRLPKPIFLHPPDTELMESWAQWAWQPLLLGSLVALLFLNGWIKQMVYRVILILLVSGSYSSLRVRHVISFDSDGARRFLPVKPSAPIFLCWDKPPPPPTSKP